MNDDPELETITGFPGGRRYRYKENGLVVITISVASTDSVKYADDTQDQRQHSVFFSIYLYIPT